MKQAVILGNLHRIRSYLVVVLVREPIEMQRQLEENNNDLKRWNLLTAFCFPSVFQCIAKLPDGAVLKVT